MTNFRLMRICLNTRRPLRKDFLICFLLGIILFTQLSSLYHNIFEIQDLSHNIDHNETRLYFETDISFKMRIKLQEKILFGGAIKEVSDNVFNAREGYNESFLDSILILRDDIPDFLPELCKNDTTVYTSRTKISVIMNYHNELLSLLLRSIYTVVAAIPQQNFHELILIDDGSNLRSHKDLLEVEPLMKSLGVHVQFHRFDNNKGLIYCRRFGSQLATGDAVLVLDSHIEVKPGFIEPLLKAVDKNYKVIAAPVFEFWDTFENKFFTLDGEALGFDQYLTWIFVNHPKDGRNFQTPAILGGAFLATKLFLEELDYFGRCLVGWGGENIEIGMKTWMCGGELIFVPCSRVLHYAARRQPMFHGEERVKAPRSEFNNGVIINSFFPDEHAKEFNLHANGINEFLSSCQDTIEANKALLTKQKCDRDYGWIRRNLMPSIESFDEETLVAHTLVAAGKCLTSQNDKLVLEDCNTPKTMRNQVRLTKWGELRLFDRRCLDWGYDPVRFIGCHRQGGNQATGHDVQSGTIYVKGLGLCLGVYGKSSFFNKGPCNGDVEKNFVVTKFKFKVVFHEDLLPR